MFVHVQAAARQREIDDERAKDRELSNAAARRTLAKRFGDLADTELAAAAKKLGSECWTRWGAFCVNKKRICDFTGVDVVLSLRQAVWLCELVDRTEQKSEQVRENLKASDADVDWSDDEVGRAVETLTWADHDRATSENGLGWSKADSSRGHWCNAMIRAGGTDKMIGIDAARAIVGKYRNQLARGE